MPAPLVGRKFGVNIVPVPWTVPPPCEDPVLGILGSSRQQPAISKSERLLKAALENMQQ